MGGGGTSSNQLATNADLSETSLESMLILISDLKDDRQIPIAATGQKLIVPPELMFVAERIVALTNDLVNQEMQFLGKMNQDPLVMLKQRELDLKAQDIQRKAQETAERLEVETNKFQAQQNIAEDKLDLAEEIQRGKLKLQKEQVKQKGDK